jgi:hypothetical protein
MAADFAWCQERIERFLAGEHDAVMGVSEVDRGAPAVTARRRVG